MSDLSGLNPTPHAIAVYASQPLSPGVTQHSLPSGRCPLLGPVFHRLDRTSLPGALIQRPSPSTPGASCGHLNGPDWVSGPVGGRRHLRILLEGAVSSK